MTPANRAPKFVVMDSVGDVRGEAFTEEDARKNAAFCDLHYSDRAPHTIHPIGPALPGPDRDGTTPGAALYNTMTPGSPIAWVYLPENHRALWETRAAAVIAAHEAGRGVPERVVRWAVRGKEGGWFGSDFCDAHKTDRTLFADRDYAADIARTFVGARLVRITTRRRRAAP